MCKKKSEDGQFKTGRRRVKRSWVRHFLKVFLGVPISNFGLHLVGQNPSHGHSWLQGELCCGLEYKNCKKKKNIREAEGSLSRISRILVSLYKSNSIAWKQITWLKNGQRTWIDISQRSTYKWLAGNIANQQGNTNPNHNVVLLHTYLNGYYQKDEIQ